MRVWKRAAGVTTLVVLLSAPVAGLGVSASNIAADSSDPGDRLTECVKKSREDPEREADLSVLFLVDTSISLRKLEDKPGTDPEGKRADVLSVVTNLLSQNTSAVDDSKKSAGTKVDVSFLDFGEAVDYSGLGNGITGWIPIDDFVSKGGPDAVMRYFPKEDDALSTDYVRALDPSGPTGKKTKGENGAIDVLSKARSQCRMMVWLTDGKMDFDRTRLDVPWATNEGSVKSLIQTGNNSLCKSDPRFKTPLVRRLVTKAEEAGGSFYLGALGLGRGSDFDLLRDIVTGKCGNNGKKIGQLSTVKQPEQLLDALVKILFPNQDLTPPTCDSRASFAPSFNLNEAVKQVKVVVTSGATEEISLRKVSDNEKRIVLLDNGRAANGEQESVRIESRRLFQSSAAVAGKVYLFATIDFPLVIGGAGWWAGDWALSTGSSCDAANSSRVFLIGDLDLVPTAGAVRRSSSGRTKLNLRLVPLGSESTVIRSGSISLKDITASVNGKTVAPEDVAVVGERVTISAAVDGESDEVTLRFTAVPSVHLESDSDISVDLPPLSIQEKKFAVVDAPVPPTVKFAGGERLNKANLTSLGTITVANSDKFLSNKVCFDDPRQDSHPSGLLPENQDRYPTVSLPGDRCVTVKPGATARLPVTFVTTDEKIALTGKSMHHAVITLPYTSDFKSEVEEERGHSEESVLLEVDLQSSLSKGLNTKKMLTYALAALLLPLGMMWTYNFAFGGLIRVPANLNVYRRRFVTTERGTSVAGESGDFTKVAETLSRPVTVAAGRLREYVDDPSSLRFLPKFSFWRFFSEPHASISSSDGQIVFGEDNGTASLDWVKGSLALSNSWYATAKPRKDESGRIALEGEFLVFHPSSADLDRAVRDKSQAFVTRSHQVVKQLNEESRAAAETGASGPSAPAPVLGETSPRPLDPKIGSLSTETAAKPQIDPEPRSGGVSMESDHDSSGRANWISRLFQRSRPGDGPDSGPMPPKSQL